MRKNYEKLRGKYWANIYMYRGFKGKKMRSDDPGNIHFGYVGAYMFPKRILLAGAGLYQIKSGTSSLKFGRSYGEDPMDNEMIKCGHTLFKKDASYREKQARKRFLKKVKVRKI